jgi:hypothetical protein
VTYELVNPLDLFLAESGDLKQDGSGLHNGNPVIHGTLTLTHSGFSRMLGDRLVREDADPHLRATTDMASDRAPRGLDLASGNAPAILGL